MNVQRPTAGALPSGLIPDALIPLRVFRSAEIPLLFVTRSIQGQDYLAYVTDVNEEGVFTLLVSVGIRTLESLETGAVSILEALTSAPPLLHWTDGDIGQTYAYELERLPPDHLPRTGVKLYASHQPVLRTRAVGESIVLGHIPASTIAFVADATRKAVKVLLDYAFEKKAEGRPTNEHRALYDLPVQSFAFASFELSFGQPDEGSVFLAELQEAADNLKKGLAWAAGDQGALKDAAPDERDAILKAVLLLTPPSNGPIEEVHLAGSWVKSREAVLTRSTRKRVQTALREDDEESAVIRGGKLSELDTERLTFILRGTSSGQEIKGSFSEEILDDMVSLLTQDVLLVGLERKGRFSASVVLPKRP